MNVFKDIKQIDSVMMRVEIQSHVNDRRSKQTSSIIL